MLGQITAGESVIVLQLKYQVSQNLDLQSSPMFVVLSMERTLHCPAETRETLCGPAASTASYCPGPGTLDYTSVPTWLAGILYLVCLSRASSSGLYTGRTHFCPHITLHQIWGTTSGEMTPGSQSPLIQVNRRSGHCRGWSVWPSAHNPPRDYSTPVSHIIATNHRSLGSLFSHFSPAQPQWKKWFRLKKNIFALISDWLVWE